MVQLHLHKQEKKQERRRYPRSSCERIIAFTSEAGSGKTVWLIGKFVDAGIGGLKIRLTQAVSLVPGRVLHCICLPSMEGQENGQAPVHILGKIAWRDDHGNYLGLEYLYGSQSEYFQ